MVQIQDFKLFLEVLETGSFTKVAASRQTVQSHISRQIIALEEQCGSPLFKRTGRGVTPTEFGLHVAAKARQWIHGTNDFFADIQETSRVPMGEVRIGILPSAAHPLMTKVFHRLQQEYPKITLNIREGQGGELDAMLDSSSVDLAILFRFDRPDTPDETLLATANTYLVSRPGVSLTQHESIDFRRLEGLPLVLPRRPAHWRSILDETAKSKGFQLHAALEADSLRIQKAVITEQAHLFALLGPFSVDQELRLGLLQASKVISPNLKRYVTLAHPKNGPTTQACKIVSNFIKQTVYEWKGQITTPLED